MQAIYILIYHSFCSFNIASTAFPYQTYHQSAQTTLPTIFDNPSKKYHFASCPTKIFSTTHFIH